MSEKVVYKYFDLKARGEPSRILLTFAGIKYEDVRYTFENWPQYKAGGCHSAFYKPHKRVLTYKCGVINAKNTFL